MEYDLDGMFQLLSVESSPRLQVPAGMEMLKYIQLLKLIVLLKVVDYHRRTLLERNSLFDMERCPALDSNVRGSDVMMKLHCILPAL